MIRSKIELDLVKLQVRLALFYPSAVVQRSGSFPLLQDQEQDQVLRFCRI